ncbi:hypothetical protein [Roseomonas elaeocarpi]|uniref:Peptidase M20 n=1 Tax=Roseomonas elaeocarpi TaxID=907779 RepID=A0ABV6JQ90_9PROT
MQQFNPAPALVPATHAEITEALQTILTPERRIRTEHPDMLAEILADQVARHLERSGFVLLRPADGWPKLPF